MAMDAFMFIFGLGLLLLIVKFYIGSKKLKKKTPNIRKKMKKIYKKIFFSYLFFLFNNLRYNVIHYTKKKIKIKITVYIITRTNKQPFKNNNIFKNSFIRSKDKKTKSKCFFIPDIEMIMIKKTVGQNDKSFFFLKKRGAGGQDRNKIPR